ncbi:ureidoglycolate lyase [Devosia neptuniae]|jgi:ureidoglycolate lyase|uniref:ureidoglycolate lyase n=1 Tax=Devosia TaxID=46913 RepID=UPI0022AFA806|nr:ureidoglycolate lyase [Devosia neptuniae]MCZ4345593.1 ureidoglycolate lyase [Devosia neptuniae]|tara:strand:- start:5286 stop:5759 length:474 start_codon:yes stop_codon:yes gene_type:complete
MSKTLKALPLNAEALAPYVSVLAASDGKARAIPEVHMTGDVPGAHALTILCPQPVAGPVLIATMERHPHSNQSFLPIRSGRWLVVVAPTAADGSPDVSGAMAFVAGPEDAICIYQNVWHAGLTVLDSPGEFGMIMWKAENGADGEVSTLVEPIAIEY